MTKIIINKADKGSTIVVRNKQDYIDEGLEHLSDDNTYIPLDSDRTDQVTVTIRSTLEKLKKLGLLSPRMANYCTPPACPRTAVIYFLKKIHKTPMGIRSIVSTTNSATANLAEFLDIYLQPIMKKLPAYLKDTTQFIHEISNLTIDNNAWLVTVDVKSLYTNIPNNEGIQACYNAWLEQETTYPQHPPAETLKELLELVLKLNVFEFNNKYYLQKFGTAMGSKLAPAYANVFMGDLEAKILAGSRLKPTHYRRFIDDIFMIWPFSEEELDRFMAHMNRINQSIKFTHEKHQNEITFLDVTVYKKPKQDQPDRCTLQTKTHVKPTNKQLYVRQDSYHPPGTGKGIIIGEATRFLRTNSEKRNLSIMLLQHKRNLIRRGYSNAVISRQLKSIKFSMRKTSLIQKSKNESTNNNSNSIIAPTLKIPKPTYTARYCPNAGKAYRIVHKHWKTITTNSSVLKRLIAKRPRLAYKANCNLSKRLVRAKLKNKSPIEQSTCEPNHTHVTKLANLTHQVPRFAERGSITQCTDEYCPLHDRLLHSSQIRSRTTRRTYNTHGESNCDTPYIAYLIQCKKCNRQYVGQTSQSLKMRFNRHLIQFGNHQIPGTLHEHFRPGKSCHGIHNIASNHYTSSYPNRVIATNKSNKLKNLEKLWMNRLKCVFPQGLNWLEDDPRTRYRK